MASLVSTSGETSLDAISKLVSLFSNSGGSTSTSTTTSGASTDAVNAAVTQALESVNGLSSIARGERSAGLYNSSVNTLLTNDLLTRAAANAAATQKTSTTSTSTKSGSGSNLAKLVGAAGIGAKVYKNLVGDGKDITLPTTGSLVGNVLDTDWADASSVATGESLSGAATDSTSLSDLGSSVTSALDSLSGAFDPSSYDLSGIDFNFLNPEDTYSEFI